MKKFKTGEILRSVCKELNLKNVEVAEIINMTPQNVSRLFQADNVNTETIDRLIEALGINIYGYLARRWDELSEEDPDFTLKDPQGKYFRHVPKLGMEDKPKMSLLIEVDPDKHSEIIKLLKL